MRCGLAVVMLAACGPNRTPAPSPPRTQPRAAEQPRAVDERIDTTKIIDSSIETVWHRDEPVVATAVPVTPSPQDISLYVEPYPRARVPGRRAPCFAQRDVLVGREIYIDLINNAVGMSSGDPPSARYGTCKIAHGELRDARGLLLADLHCGITVHTRGIVDHLGFEIGASPKDIAAEHPDLETICAPDDDAHTRCWFQSIDGNASRSDYVVDGLLATDPDSAVTRGPRARDFFTSAAAITSFTVRITCH